MGCPAYTYSPTLEPKIKRLKKELTLAESKKTARVVYLFGFNSMPKDNEIYGPEGSGYDFGARIYDSRLGRFFSVDRFSNKFPFNSSYLISSNNPIVNIDINGDSTVYILRGEAIYVSHDELPNAIVVLNFETALQEEIFLNQLDIHKNDNRLNSDAVNTIARKFGSVYLTDGFVRARSVALSQPPLISGLLPEIKFNIYQNGNVFSLGCDYSTDGLPGEVTSGPSWELGYGEKVGEAHSHPNAGNGFEFGLSDRDISKSYKESGDDVAFDKWYIHFVGLTRPLGKNGKIDLSSENYQSFSIPFDFLFDKNIVGKLKDLGSKIQDSQSYPRGKGLPDRTPKENLGL